MSSILSFGEYLVDQYKIATIGNSMITTFLSFDFLMYNTPLFSFFLGSTSIGIYLGYQLSKPQYDLAKRLNNSLRDNKFRKNAFKPTTKTWCDTQTAIVVSKRNDCLENYIDLCNCVK